MSNNLKIKFQSNFEFDFLVLLSVLITENFYSFNYKFRIIEFLIFLIVIIGIFFYIIVIENCFAKKQIYF